MAIALLVRQELVWLVFAAANLVAMALWPTWETIPFHFIWVSLTLLYGFRVWRPLATYPLLVIVALATEASSSPTPIGARSSGGSFSRCR